MTFSIAWLWRIEAWLRRRRYQVIGEVPGREILREAVSRCSLRTDLCEIIEEDMEQGDGYCDDACPCDRCRSVDTGEAWVTYLMPQPMDTGLVEAFAHMVGNPGGLLARQQAAIDELVSIAGYLPEAYAILAKHGLR